MSFRLEKLSQFNFIVSVLTLVVLIWYAYDTHRIANQTLESNLRPIILRNGYIKDWESIRFTIRDDTINGSPIGFSIKRNIAKDISGYIILDNKKHVLLFGNQMTKINDTPIALSSTQKLYSYNPVWGWSTPDNELWAVFTPTQFQRVQQENSIYIQYKDIENNSYFTKEDKNFSQTLGNL